MNPEDMKKLRKRAAPVPKGRARIVRKKTFSLEGLMKHVDPGPPSEAEEFVRLIYEDRRRDREHLST